MRRKLGLALAIGASVLSATVIPLAGPSASAASSGAPILVGGLGDLALAGGIAQGFEAGIYRFNKAGGLDGRKIKFSGFLDDGFSPQTNLSQAHQLVQNQHVFAVVPFFSEVFGAATATFLTDSRVPFVGYHASPAWSAAPKWGLPINGNLTNPQDQPLPEAQAMLSIMGATKDPGKVKIALIGQETVAVAGTEGLANLFKYVGMHIAYEQEPVPETGTTNYAPYAQAIISSGANAVFEVVGTSDCVGIAAALKAAGWKGYIFNGTTYFPGQLASSPSEAAALDHVYTVSVFPTSQNNTPAVKQAEKDLVSVGMPPQLTIGASVGYWSAIVFEQMLRATLRAVGGNPSKVTGQALQKTVISGFTYTDPTPGGIGTEYFPEAETVPTPCRTIVQQVGTAYKAVTPYTCGNVVNLKTGKIISTKSGKPVG